MKSFCFNPKEETPTHFTDRMCNALYPEGAKYCMMHCKFATGYSDGSGAYCNNKDSPDYGERVRSWDTVSGCRCFEEGERVKDQDEED